mmetsp:Transcript_20091/g.22359  ORF Transcript_20091/g.22359 Transcript_20091/m.22359 type:complete len:382 (+) Transcript_20091:93-1238(+)
MAKRYKKGAAVPRKHRSFGDAVKGKMLARPSLGRKSLSGTYQRVIIRKGSKDWGGIRLEKPNGPREAFSIGLHKKERNTAPKKRKLRISTSTFQKSARIEPTIVVGEKGRGWCDGKLEDSSFDTCKGMGVDYSGNLILGDWENFTLRKIDLTDRVVSTIRGNPGVYAFRPWRIHCPSRHVMVYLDYRQSGVVRINTKTGEEQRCKVLQNPSGLTMDDNGDTIVTCPDGIYAIDKSWEFPPLRIFESDLWEVDAIAFLSKDKYLVSGSSMSRYPFESSVMIIDLQLHNSKVLIKFPGILVDFRVCVSRDNDVAYFIMTGQNCVYEIDLIANEISEFELPEQYCDLGAIVCFKKQVIVFDNATFSLLKIDMDNAKLNRVFSTT